MRSPVVLTIFHSYNLASPHSHPSMVNLPLHHQRGADTRKTKQSGQDRLLHWRGTVGDGGKRSRTSIGSDGG